MLFKLKQWLKGWLQHEDNQQILELLEDKKYLQKNVEEKEVEIADLKKQAWSRTEEFSSELMRRMLGSINEDEEAKQMTPEERRAYVSRISENKSVVLAMLKRLERDQVDVMLKKAVNTYEVIFARGTLNGICLVMEEFEECYNEAKQMPPAKQTPDKTSLFPTQKP